MCMVYSKRHLNTVLTVLHACVLFSSPRIQSVPVDPIDWKFNIGNYLFFFFLSLKSSKTTFQIKQLGKFDFCTLFTIRGSTYRINYIRTPAIITFCIDNNNIMSHIKIKKESYSLRCSSGVPIYRFVHPIKYKSINRGSKRMSYDSDNICCNRL